MLKDIAVIGAGNGGQAIAGHLASMGLTVRLYDRNKDKVEELNKLQQISLSGAVNARGTLKFASTDLGEVVRGAELIMVTTTATAHADLASKLAPILIDNQIIVLNPGRTCGAIEFRNTLEINGLSHRVYVAEAQTLVYACRLICTGNVNIIGIKDTVLFAAYPSSDTGYVGEQICPLFPCFKPVDNVLHTGFENIGAIFHPAVVLFNEAAIERGNKFYFYRDMTDGLARLVETVDNERLAVAQAYGFYPMSAFDWVSYAYGGVAGATLCERMHNNPAYYEILAPSSIKCRQITEDIPTGLIPLAELGRAANIQTPAMTSIISMCSILLDHNFLEDGRTLERLGLNGLSVSDIIQKIC